MERVRRHEPGNATIVDIFGLPFSLNLTFVQFYEYPDLDTFHEVTSDVCNSEHKWDAVPAGCCYIGNIGDEAAVSKRGMHGCLIVCYPPEHKADWYATITHEASHLVDGIFHNRDIPPHEQNTEVRSWLVDYIAGAYWKYFLPSSGGPRKRKSK